MVTDTRRKQKQLERRKAKDKDRARKRALAQRDPRDIAARIERAATAPILHCCTTDVLWDEGMSHVLVSRKLPSGNVAFVAFLVDVYCLGVKDVFFNVVSRGAYDSMLYGKLIGDYQMVKLAPPEARKLIEGAVEYAGNLGLPPHPDYRTAKAILGDIDGDEYAQEFVYGKDGKPFFIAGPHDSKARCDQVVSILTARCGPNGFHFLMPDGSAGTSLAGARVLRIDDSGELG